MMIGLPHIERSIVRLLGAPAIRYVKRQLPDDTPFPGRSCPNHGLGSIAAEERLKP